MLKHQKAAKLHIETLEDRMVPASLVNPKTMTFQDVDGDIAAVVFSRPVLNIFNVDQVFQFDVGSVNGSNAQRQRLRKIDLDVLTPFDLINGSDMTVRVITRGLHGNGEVHVGEVLSLNNSFGKLDFQGDVSQFNMFNYVGDQKIADGITVNSTGRFDPQGNSLQSLLFGYVSKFLVRGDLAGSVMGGSFGSVDIRGSVKGSFASGDIDSVTIGGEIDGRAYANPVISTNGIGSFTAGAVGTFSLGGSVLGGAFGGQLSLNGSGKGNLATVTIGGSIRGGSVPYSGTVNIRGAYQSVTVKGSVIGGSGDFSAFFSPGDAQSVFLGGSIIGGTGFESGLLSNWSFDPPFTNVIDKVQIKGSIIGGSGYGSGLVRIVNPIKQFILGGAIQGGIGDLSANVTLESQVRSFQCQGVNGAAGYSSGRLFLQNSNPSTFVIQDVVLNGSVKAGTGPFSGNVYLQGSTNLHINGSVVGSIGYQTGYVQMTSQPSSAASSFSILGSVIGAAGDSSGSVALDSVMDRVSILGNLVGAQGNTSGSMTLTSHTNTLSVGGSLLGGNGYGSGAIVSGNGADAIRIGKNVTGAAGYASGSLNFNQSNIRQLTVDGTVLGGKGDRSGVIHAQSIDDIRIGGSVLGGDGALAGGINADTRLGSVRINGSLAGNFGYVFVGRYLGEGYLDSIWIGGDVRSSGIVSSGAIGTVTVLGSILGTDAAPSYVTANGITPSSGANSDPYLLKSLTVVGNVAGTYLYLGNYSFNQVEVARVGRIAVGGNWSNNLLTVGYTAGPDGQWGTADDERISPDAPSSIDSLFIAGSILGIRTSLVQAGFIIQLKLKQSIINLTPGEFNDDLVLSQLLRVREKA